MRLISPTAKSNLVHVNFEEKSDFGAVATHRTRHKLIVPDDQLTENLILSHTEYFMWKPEVKTASSWKD